MINILQLYNLIKPLNNENSYTEFPLIIGATDTALSLEKGLWILNLINSEVQSGGSSKIEVIDGKFFDVREKPILTTYQLDFYKSFNNKEDINNVVQVESMKMRGYLNSIDAMMYLDSLNSEILPVIDAIGYTSEIGSNKAVLNRAMMEFSIISREVIKVQVDVASNIKLIGGALCRNS